MAQGLHANAIVGIAGIRRTVHMPKMVVEGHVGMSFSACCTLLLTQSSCAMAVARTHSSCMRHEVVVMFAHDRQRRQCKKGSSCNYDGSFAER